jgi:DNA-cytosine methyltransferase
MKNGPTGLTVLDLFCGAGGFSLGFYQTGFDIVLGIDYWEPACKTHEVNRLGKTKKINLLEWEIEDIIKLKMDLESKHGKIDVIIGSPPCTEFSYSNNGGGGNLQSGMLLVRKYLKFIVIFSPKYWVMENVPRLGKVLDDQFERRDKGGWNVPLQNLGFSEPIKNELGIHSDVLEIPVGEELLASDFGTRQNRKRFIAGNYPIDYLQKIKLEHDDDKSLRPIIESINNATDGEWIKDPNYNGHLIKSSNLRDNCIRQLHPMHWEELRHQKRRHIQYGQMELPEKLDRPARTVLATHNISSRESFVLGTNNNRYYQGKLRKIYRQPSIREIASIQGFPLDFQLAAPTLSERYRLIGNAVPCQLSYAIALAILSNIEKDLKTIKNTDYRERASETLRRKSDNSDFPILPKPEIQPEANDFKNGEFRFSARPNKHIRRKLLSSKIVNDTSMIVFENTVCIDDKMNGGFEWKVCLQKGVGSTYSKVFLDEVSIKTILQSIDSKIDSEVMKEAVRLILNKVDEGIPILDDAWEEFPGYHKGAIDHLVLINNTRLKPLNIVDFQNTFTRDINHLEGHVGPIDMFDGLDAIMLSVFTRKEFESICKSNINMKHLVGRKDQCFKNDDKIIWSITNKRIPFVTLACGLMSVHLLQSMYAGVAEVRGSQYRISLEAANAMIHEWLNE